VFTLEVEFTGLCLYVKHLDGQYTVMLPDCRDKIASAVHVDGDKHGIPHAGYVRVDGAALGMTLTSATGGEPNVEVVHQLAREELNLSGLDGTKVENTPTVPSFDPGKFDDIGLIDGLFGEQPKGLLSRFVLSGGAFDAGSKGRSWTVPGWLNASGKGDMSDLWSGRILWRKSMDGDSVTLMVREFGASSADATSLTLRPVLENGEPVVRIRVANNCAENPLLWSSLGLRSDEYDTSDKDFKWLYRLLKSTGKDDMKTRCANSAHKSLPYPILDPDNVLQSNRRCMGGTISVSY
jgi:hypothetical protein